MKISKMKKTPGDIIILHKCTKNHDHPLCCSRDMARDGCNCYFHFGKFLPFYPPYQPEKWKFQKNEKKQQQQKKNKKKTNKQNKAKPGGIIILHKCPKNHDTCYAVPEIYGA